MNADLIFWPGTAYARSIEEHIGIAETGGFTSIAIPPEVYQWTIERGISPRDMQAMAADRGVPVRHIDTVAAWAPVRLPQDASDAARARFDVPLDRIFEIADQLEVETILACAAYEFGTVENDLLYRGFSDLCDRARERGIWVDLEFMPSFGLPDLKAAWNIIETVNRPNAGIMVDTWHFLTGAPDWSLLTRIPGERLQAVQLADCSPPLEGRNFSEESISSREFPGEGVLPLSRVLSALTEKGGLRRIGTEIFNPLTEQMAASDLGARLGQSMRQVMGRSEG